MNKIALFGGSFDPVHKSHEQIIKKLSKQFDKVIVIPSFISPFKKKQKAAPSEHRVQMLANAVGNIKNVIISDYEIQKGGVSYSVDTAAHFAAEYTDAELFFVIGSEMLKGLSKWKSFNILKKAVTFFVINREGFVADNDTVAALIKKGAKIELSKIKMEDCSSAFAKVSAAFGKTDVVSAKTLKYIKSNGLYSDYANIVAAFDDFKMDSERKEHVYRTVKASIYLAKLNGADVQKTALAALLHDIGKTTDYDTLKSFKIVLSPEILALPKKIIHAKIGEQIAKTHFKIKDKEILGAISKHTTGDVEMTDIEKIVFLADCIEEGRNFSGIDEARKIIFSSLDDGMALMLDETISKLQSKNQNIYHTTFDAFKYYKTLAGYEAQKIEQVTAAKPRSTEPLNAADSPYDLAYTVAQLLDEKKGRDIAIVEVGHKTIVTDYFVIASVTSATAVRALTDYIDEKLSKQYGIEPLRRDIDANWAAVDYGSIILHILCDEIRAFYDLEKLWSDGKNVERFGGK